MCAASKFFVEAEWEVVESTLKHLLVRNCDSLQASLSPLFYLGLQPGQKVTVLESWEMCDDGSRCLTRLDVTMDAGTENY